MACGQLLNADGSKQNSIAAFPTLISLLVNVPLLEILFPARYPSKRQEYRRPIEVDSGMGACLIVRKSAIDGVGGFDERYFFFFEETDWARTMREAGWKIYEPLSKTPEEAVQTLSELGFAGIEWRVVDQAQPVGNKTGFWQGNRCTWPFSRQEWSRSGARCPARTTRGRRSRCARSSGR